MKPKSGLRLLMPSTQQKGLKRLVRYITCCSLGRVWQASQSGSKNTLREQGKKTGHEFSYAWRGAEMTVPTCAKELALNLLWVLKEDTPSFLTSFTLSGGEQWEEEEAYRQSCQHLSTEKSSPISYYMPWLNPSENTTSSQWTVAVCIQTHYLAHLWVPDVECHGGVERGLKQHWELRLVLQ